MVDMSQEGSGVGQEVIQGAQALVKDKGQSQAQGTWLHGVLLIAGTTIGGGMLAAPVLMAPAGFYPSVFVYILYWLLMSATGILLTEACLWSNRETNLISLTQITWGKWATYLTWTVYLCFFFCLILAYLLAEGALLSSSVGGAIPQWVGSCITVAVLIPILYFGTPAISRINLPLMIGLILSYAAFVILGSPKIQWENLQRAEWHNIFLALPIAFTAFGFQGTVPSLTHYFHRDGRLSRQAILWGTFIPLIVYIIWQALILGIVPYMGPGSLFETHAHGGTAVDPLKHVLGTHYVYALGQAFSFFAITTTLLGVSLGLRDFLADGLKLTKTPTVRLILSIAIFIPPLIVAYSRPDLFLVALDWAGGLGGAFLLALLPIAIVWVGRYRLGLNQNQLLPGGKPLLIIMAVGVALEMIMELVKLARALWG